ncbi:MAG: VCBS domain-containing protein, partial [Burkholderiales bacterium]|nr:VCBS domain-containing protein [Burkholderiales bacterium]
MSKPAHVPGGTVVSIQGRATVIPAGAGAARVLKVGDVIHEGDAVLTPIGTKLIIQDAKGNPWVPRDVMSSLAHAASSAVHADHHGKALHTKIQALLADDKNHALDKDLDRAIQAVDKGEGDAVPAAGLSGGGGSMTPGLRVDRVIEVVSGQEFVYGDTERAPNAEGTSAQAVVQNTAVTDAVAKLNATDDTFTTTKGVMVALPVLANDGIEANPGTHVIEINGQPILPGQPIVLDNGLVQMTSTGALTFSPASGFVGNQAFTYTTTDSSGQTATATVQVNVLPPSDVPVANPDLLITQEDKAVTFVATGNDDPGSHGPIAITEINGQSITSGASVQVAHGSVTLNADGSLTVTPDASYSGNISFSYTIADQTGQTSNSSVNVQVNPVNHAPVIGDSSDPSYDPASGTYHVTTHEDQAVNGKVTATDPDSDPLSFGKGSDPAHGQVTVNPDGTWTYTPSQDYNGSDAFTVVVSDGQGHTTTTTVNVGVTPVPDAAVIGSTGTHGAVAEDTGVDSTGHLTTGGALSVSDPDAGEAGFQANTVNGAYGTFTIGTDGTWTYSADNSQTAVQQLGAGQTLTETFTVKSTDGTPATVTVTINGTNDAAVISSAGTTGSVTEDVAVDGTGHINTGGTLSVTDVDAGQAGFQANTVHGAYGTFTIGTDGTWTYSADNSQSAVQQLGAGQTLTETFTVKSTDGTPASVTVTINGT